MPSFASSRVDTGQESSPPRRRQSSSENNQATGGSGRMDHALLCHLDSADVSSQQRPHPSRKLHDPLGAVCPSGIFPAVGRRVDARPSGFVADIYVWEHLLGGERLHIRRDRSHRNFGRNCRIPCIYSDDSCRYQELSATCSIGLTANMSSAGWKPTLRDTQSDQRKGEHSLHPGYSDRKNADADSKHLNLRRRPPKINDINSIMNGYIWANAPGLVFGKESRSTI